MCGRGFGWGNGRGLLGCDWISPYIPIAFSFPEILHATRVSTTQCLYIQSLANVPEQFTATRFLLVHMQKLRNPAKLAVSLKTSIFENGDSTAEGWQCGF